MDIASRLIISLEARVRGPNERRRQGTIARRAFIDRRRHIHDFLAHLTKQHGKGTASRMLLSENTLADVEGYNRWVVRQGYSVAQGNDRMQMVKLIMERGDGWPSQRDRYALPQHDVLGLVHDIAYRALDDGSIES